MHRRAASQRHGMPRVMGHIPYHGPATNPTAFLWFIGFFRPRKSRLRVTFFCLFFLIAVTTYVCLVSPPVLSPDHPLHPYRSKLPRFEDPFGRKLKSPQTRVSLRRQDVSLSPEEELGALTAFMAALPQNVIPSNIDPAQSIDPQLVLDFDTRGPRAEEEIANLVADVWVSNPVVLFAKLRSAVSRELKSILNDMDLKPPPTIFDVDQRADAMALAPLLLRLTNSTELPVLLIGGSTVGSMDTIRELDASGKLKALVMRAGAIPASDRKPRKGRR